MIIIIPVITNINHYRHLHHTTTTTTTATTNNNNIIIDITNIGSDRRRAGLRSVLGGLLSECCLSHTIL